MIITRTPFRISFAGGGSDLSAFTQRDIGAVFSMTINLHMNIIVAARADGVRLMYSQTENVAHAHELEHDIARACLELCSIDNGVEIASLADVPAGSGLGSSSAYAVGLLLALAELNVNAGMSMTGSLAMQAAHAEINMAGRPVGMQDHASAAYGGLRLYEFDETIIPKIAHDDAIGRELAHMCLLFRVGQTRNAERQLRAQNDAVKNDNAAHAKTAQMARMARELNTAASKRDWLKFGAIMREAWRIKTDFETSTDEVDRAVALALDAGAYAAKLCGAGGGGFVLVFAERERHDAIRAAMSQWREQRFDFEPHGARVVYRD